MQTDFRRARYGQLDCLIASHPEAGAIATGVVILCHGFGAPGADLAPIADEWFRNYPEFKDVRFVFPAAPLELDPAYDARAWWEIDIERVQQLMQSGDFRDLRNSQPPRLAVCREMLEQLVGEVASDLNLESSQVVVGGFSQGAMLTTDLMVHSSVSLGGLICWSGSLINEANWRAAASANANTPVVQSHGRSDPILPFAGAEALLDLLVEAGNEVEFVPFEGEHAIPPEALNSAALLIQRACCSQP